MRLYVFASLLYLLLACFFKVYGVQIDLLKLDDEIAELNDAHQYEQSILKLEGLINDPKTTVQDRAFLLIQKSLTYKRLYNYSAAMNYLTRAEEELRKGGDSKEMESRVLIERLFIYFDLGKKEEFENLLKQVTQETLKYIGRETKAFYISILGDIELKNGHFEQADAYFDESIALLEKERPRDLPNIYRAKVTLYNRWGKKEEAMEAYKKGLFYADIYKVDLYKIIMYETLLNYYVENSDYKNAYFAQKKVSEVRSAYDAANRSGKLSMLEKELLQQRSEIEKATAKKTRFFLIAISLVSIAFAIVLFLLFKSNREKRIYIEKENDYMRSMLEKYAKSNPDDMHEREHLASTKNLLTKRHVEIIALVKEGKSNKEIGALLFISENTVKYHLKKIYEILEIESRSDLKREGDLF